MNIEEFEEAIKGCDCMEANVMGNYSMGCSSFTFDCDMMGPEGRVCVSGELTKDDEDKISGVNFLVFRDYSEIEDGDSFEDAPIIDDPDEIGGILNVLASRFTHDGGDEGELPSNMGCWL